MEKSINKYLGLPLKSFRKPLNDETIMEDNGNISLMNIEIIINFIVERNSINELCTDYDDIFYMEFDALTNTDVLLHTIRIILNQPAINQKNSRLPIIHKYFINEFYNYMNYILIKGKTKYNKYNNDVINVIQY